MSLFAGRIDFTADVYNKQTEDMLLQLSVPSYLGGPNPWEDIAAPYANVGKMENKGIDLSLTTHNLRQGNISWITNLTFSLNRNLVKELDDTSKVYWKTTQRDMLWIWAKRGDGHHSRLPPTGQ